MTPVLAASTLIVMGDVVECGVDLDGKDVIFVYPIVGPRLGKKVMKDNILGGITCPTELIEVVSSECDVSY